MNADHQGIYQDAFRFGMELIPDSYIGEVIKLLKIPDEYVYQAALERLKSSAMQSAEEALKKDAASFASFIQPCIEHLTAAGISAKPQGHDIRGAITIKLRHTEFAKRHRSRCFGACWGAIPYGRFGPDFANPLWRHLVRRGKNATCATFGYT